MRIGFTPQFSVPACYRQLHFDQGAPAGLGFDVESTSQMTYPLLHAKHSEPAGAYRVKAASIILHADANRVRRAFHRNLNRAGLRVPGRVIQGFLHDTIEDTHVSAEKLKRAFGPRVASLVAAVSEPDKLLSWKQRKEHSLAAFEEARDADVLALVAADKLDNVRSVVKNELRERIENKPYAAMLGAGHAELFPEDHPYHRLPIGTVQDLDAASLDDVRSFFLRWYGPNNADIVIVGDVDVAQTVARVRHWFGAIPKSPDPPVIPKSPRVRLAKDRRVIIDADVALPRLRVVYEAPPYGEADYYRLRPTIAVPRPGKGDVSAVDLDGFFGLHPRMASLKPLWDNRSLAIVHACGSPDNTRSHFDAQDYMETATPGVKSTRDGWLNRYLQVAHTHDTPLTAVAVPPLHRPKVDC